MELKKVMVIGAGQMGSGIAQVMAAHGVEVVLRDIKQEFVDRGIKNIEKNLTRSVEKGRITEDEKKATLGRITGVVEMTKETCNVHLAIEAATENVKIKKDIFQTLDELCPEDAIIASNTSSVSITMLGGFTKRADKFIGMHFFNPADRMKLIEVIAGCNTPAETVEKIKEISVAIGKNPVQVNEAAGFVVNRILIPMMNEAMGIVADGIASPADVDVAMQLGAGMKSGPLHTADLVGHDVNLAIMETLYHETGDPKYRPHPLMRQMVRAGWLGVKTGKGFFEYDGPFGKEIVK